MSTAAWVATRKGLFELRRVTHSQPWRIARVSFLGDPVSMVLPGNDHGSFDGRMFAALNLGHFGVKLHASDDDGKTWHELATPAYPPQPESEVGAVAQGPAWKLTQIWAMERSANSLWIGTLPGGLFRSEDGGEHWQLVESLWQRPERLEWMGGGYDAPGIHSICPHPLHPGELLLGISCGGAWRSSDDAQTWHLRAQGMRAEFMPPDRQGEQNVQDPHCIARCEAAPDVLWCQHHNGIFRSIDNGASWQELSAQPSSFGFAVAAHPLDAQTAWFVPAVKDEKRIPTGAALCVTRTRDGGQSFEALRKGLPQQDCYDLIYRHGLTVDETGRHLLMGSTTGNLWTSDDGGESWQSVPAHLPPVYALRFG